jgi:eukaryotic-like serine/threonine-protein kinase
MPPILWYCPTCQTEGSEPGVEFCRSDGARVRAIHERGAEWIGKVLDGKYRVLRFIDAGGTAEVYEAERTGTGKRVALKVLHAALAARPEVMESFLQEAQLVSLIAHPNIVAIQDFGTLPGAVHYMVMELLDGRPLSTEIARGPLPVLTALRYAMEACEGLAAAHARDVIHCDIKPANIFLQRVPGQKEPVVKVLDLGIGRLFAGARAERLGTPESVAGTPEYMSPEQALGRPLGPASDIYSMGVAIYEMLLGTVPFSDGSYVKVLHRHVNEPAPWPTDLAEQRSIPAGARDVVWRALAKNPADRQGSMLELQRELAGLGRLEKAKASTREVTSRAHTIPAAPLSSEPPRTSKGLRAAREFSVEEEASSGRWRLAPSRRASRRPAVSIVPLGESTGADDEVVELAPDVYWVGRRQGQLLECNSYLRVWRDGATQVSVLTDPGPPKNLEVVSQKVAAVLGSIKKLDYVFLSNHDPDVASNAAPIQQGSLRTRILCSEETFRLAQLYGLDPRRFTAVESFPGGRTELATGYEVVFVPSPFCHVHGAVMLYDAASRALFTGNLFGGPRASDLVAGERSWPGVEMFHQLFMPSRRALALAVARIRRLDPPPILLAPQHGALVARDDVPRMLDRIENLEVGLDLLELPVGKERMVSAGNELVREFAELAGHARAKELLGGFAEDTSFPRVLVVEDGQITGFKVAPRLALEALASDALAALPADQRGDLQRSILAIWRQHELEPTSMAPTKRDAG